MLRENLEEMTVGDIRTLAYQNKIELPRTVTKKADIIDRMVESLASQGQQDETFSSHKRPPKVSTKALTKDDISNALEGLTGFKLHIDEDSNTWTLAKEIEQGGRKIPLIESGTLFMPITAFRKCAELFLVQ